MIKLTINEVSFISKEMKEKLKGVVNVNYDEYNITGILTIITDKEEEIRVWRTIFKESKEEIDLAITIDKMNLALESTFNLNCEDFLDPFNLKSLSQGVKLMNDDDLKLKLKKNRIRGIHTDKLIIDDLLNDFKPFEHLSNSSIINSIDAMYSCMCRCDTFNPFNIFGDLDNKKEYKMKTKNLTFDLGEERKVTLVAISKEEDLIEVGYSVCYKDDFNEELGKKIAKGRAEKLPIYSVEVEKDISFFMKSTLGLVKKKLLDGDLKIKGIRTKADKKELALKWWKSLTALEQRGTLHLNGIMSETPSDLTNKEIQELYYKK